MKFGDKIKTKRRKRVYIYLEDLNRIVKHKIPVLSKKKRKELKNKGFIPYIHITINGQGMDLDNFIYDSTLKGCELKVRKYFFKKIKILKNQLDKVIKKRR